MRQMGSGHPSGHVVSEIKDQVNSGFISGRRIYSRAGSTNSVCKGQMEDLLGFPDHKVSDTAAQFCHHPVKAATDNSKRMAVAWSFQ